MAEFTADTHNGFRQALVPNFSFLDQNQFAELEGSSFQSIIGFSGDNFFSHQPSSEFSGDVFRSSSLNHVIIGDDLQIISGGRQAEPDVIAMKTEYEILETKKRKAADVSQSTSATTSSIAAASGNSNKNSSKTGKKAKVDDDKEEEKPKEVVHVRARRGQATDSHSLAERVRRGKINERLRCLQDIVPGCYKTMGMAVMLDEIINYVQSLQNQVEFLSMKLTAASSFHDFNSDTDAIEMMQRAKAAEAQEMERLTREGYGGASSTCFNSTTTTTWPL